MSDSTEGIRRQMVGQMGVALEVARSRGEQTWETDDLLRDFIVIAYAAPFAVVVNRVTGVKGTLMFTHRPRVYFGWEPQE